MTSQLPWQEAKDSSEIAFFLMALDGEEIRLQLWKNSKSLYESVFFIASIVVLSSIQVPQNDEPFRPSYKDTQSWMSENLSLAMLLV